MLNIFRKHARSWFIKVALFLIAIVFIFWGGYSYREMDASRVARVNDRYISYNEYNKAYDQLLDMYRSQLGNAFSEEMIRQFNVRQQALDMLIERDILTRAAHDMGLAATDQEVQQRILEYPVFQVDGKFDHDRYLAVLHSNRLSPEAFEESLASDLAVQKVESFIKRQAIVTEEEIRADFLFNGSRIRVAYVRFDPKSYENQVTVDEKAVEAFYESHKEQYKEPEKRKFSFVIFDVDSYVEGVEVTEEQIARYYEDHRDKYHQEPQVRARHILFRLPEDAPESEVNTVKAEAEKVLVEAKKGGAGFAELAKKHSQDPAAQNGGDLGFFTRERMIPAFSEAAFALKPGEISDLVRTPYGFHIIKVEEVRPEKTTTLEEARKEIELALKRDQARELAYDKARGFGDLAYAQRDIVKAAQGEKLAVKNMQEWLAPGDPLPDLEGIDPKAMAGLFALSEKETSNVLEVDKGFVVAQVQAVKAAEVPPLKEVKERVEKDYRAEQARMLAEKDASALLEAAGKAGSLEKAAGERNLEVRQSDWFSRRKPDKDLHFLGGTQNTLFELAESDPFPQKPLQVADDYLVAQLLGKEAPPEEDFEKERSTISQRILLQKQSQLWQAWLETQRSKADIEIYQKL